MEENKQNQNNVAALEAVMFLYGEPMDLEKLSKVMKISTEEAKTALEELKNNLLSENRGLILIEKGGSFVLATKPEFSSFLDNFVRENLKEDLTPASLETLSLIAYFSPISRAQIDYIRGVNSSFILRNLLIRGLVDRKMKGNMYLYEPSFDFLKHLGLENISQLPEFVRFQQIKDNYFSAESSKSENQPAFI
ncbi:MAG: SMC-Scp complex subunit ScpB [Candidatus Paceibacterota bacterium]|jgi:segregation and condensation protein B